MKFSIHEHLKTKIIMSKKIIYTCIAYACFLTTTNAQTKGVSSSEFGGTYFSEEKMVVKVSGGRTKKTNEIVFSFDEKTGKLSGMPDMKANDPLVFYADPSSWGKWSRESGVWTWANSNTNGTAYGKEMFDYSNFSNATFIEPGVLVIFEKYSAKDKKVRMFDVTMDVKKIRIMAKDKNKLTMDKLEAAKKAEEMVNATAGAQMKKILDGQNAAAVAVPNESLSKTDKALKAEITTLLTAFVDNADGNTEILCIYTTSADWTIINNKQTGAILSREINAEMVLKNKVSGKCQRVPYTLTAPYNGTGFGKLKFKQKWNEQPCDCSQAAKNK